MFVLLCSRLLLLLLLMCVCTCVKRSDFNDSSRIEMLEWLQFFCEGLRIFSHNHVSVRDYGQRT